MIEYGYVEWDDGNSVSGPMQLSDAIDFAELSLGKFYRCEAPNRRRFNLPSFGAGVVLGIALFLLGLLVG